MYQKSKSRKSQKSPNCSNILEIEKFRKLTTVAPSAIKNLLSIPRPILEISKNYLARMECYSNFTF